MKKLLALLLSVMLFVSVIPGAAYAKAKEGGSGIDLSPAYEAMNDLNVAYSKLAVANAYNNGLNGINAIENKTNGMKEVAIKDIRGTAKNSRTSGIKSVKSPLSFEAVFARVAPSVVDGYETVGNGVARGIGDGINDIATSVGTSASNIFSSFALS